MQVGIIASLVSIAELFSEGEKITTKEVELWVQYMTPVHGAPLDWMKTALLNWHAAMREAGLSSYDIAEFEEFVRGSTFDGIDH